MDIDRILYEEPNFGKKKKGSSSYEIDGITLLRKVSEDMQVSDVHIRVGMYPQVRRLGRLQPLKDFPILTKEDTQRIVYSLLKDKQKKILEEELSLDFSVEVSGAGRFRGNAFFYDNGKLGCVFRKINERIPPLSSLGLPPVVERLKEETKGLILVTGMTGSGKSTTCAALCNEILQERGIHLLTIEDPIEYRYDTDKGVVTQREVGTDVKNFAKALKDALREDPDVILVGEMRDKETIETALHAAESGHLVISTLHTNSAAETINRIVNVFPEEARPQVRTVLSFVIKGIINQVLLPKADGTGRVVAAEVVLFDPALRNIIRDGKMQQFVSSVQMTKKNTGSVLMNESLAELVKAGLVKKEEALLHSPDKDSLLKEIGKVKSW